VAAAATALPVAIARAGLARLLLTLLTLLLTLLTLLLPSVRSARRSGG
jgi:hypothetical protein